MNKNLKPYIKSILEFLRSEGIKLDPMPKLVLKRDLSESENPLGKTGYYEQTTNEVVIYTEGRHTKDILRSFVHEIVHHNQLLRLGKIDTNTENVNKSVFLEKIEADAYLRGNMLFRKWENQYKDTK